MNTNDSWLPEDDKQRKSNWPIWDYQFTYFPLAFLEEVKVSVEGNKQHNPGQKLHWAREKSTDQLNTAARHQFDYANAKANGEICPRDKTGKSVLAQAIWRLKAQLQLDCEAERAERAKRAQKTHQTLYVNGVLRYAVNWCIGPRFRDGALYCYGPECPGHLVDDTCLVEKLSAGAADGSRSGTPRV